LYRAAQDAFTVNDVRVLEAMRPGLERIVSPAQKTKAFVASSNS